MKQKMNQSLKVFITYSHENPDAKDELIKHLAIMVQQDLITIWHDNEILPGDRWYKDIAKNLAGSDILLYLVSASSLASENCNKELADALDINIKVIPIILEDCDWQNHQLGDIEVLPDKGKPINEWLPESSGWQNVVEGIRKVVGEMQALTSDSAKKETLPEWVFQQGNFLMMIGQIGKAIGAYSHVIELNPRYATTYNNRGSAYVFIRAYNQAIKDFNKAIELNRDFAGAYSYYNRGNAYILTRAYDRAIEDFNKAIELNRDFVEAYNNRSMCWLHLQNWQGVRSDLTDARDRGGDIIAVFRNNYKNVEEFERRHGVKLPEDIAAMLTQE